MTNLEKDIIEQLIRFPGTKLTSGNLILLLNGRGYTDQQIIEGYEEFKKGIPKELQVQWPHAQTHAELYSTSDPCKELETKLYDEFNDKVKETKEYIVSKVDQFFQYQINALQTANHEQWHERIRQLQSCFSAKQLVDHCLTADLEADEACIVKACENV